MRPAFGKGIVMWPLQQKGSSPWLAQSDVNIG